MSLQTLLNRIDELQATIEAVGKFDPEVLKKINYKFRLDWNYHSNAMEGNSLTKEETRSMMVNNVSVRDKPLKDVLEMKGHDQIVSDILKIGKGELNISEKRIKDIHKAIIHEDDLGEKQKIGQWKTVNNHLINYKDEKFDFLDYQEVPEAMHSLINWLNHQIALFKIKSPEASHPSLIAFEFHLKYLTIHPFYDGNGRTARVLMNLILISFGYPPLIIKKDEKDIYYRYLGDIQGYGGSPDLYFEFMSKLLIHSQELVLKAIHGESIEEPDDLDKEIELLKRQLANKEFTKSPKNIYEAYLYVNKEVWKEIETVLKGFDDFFSESKTIKYVNNLEEDFGTRKTSRLGIMHFTEEESLKPKDPKIFGHSIYETDIKTIKWENEKLGLKGAVKKGAIQIDLLVQFNLNNYSISLKLDYNKVFTQQINYGSYIEIDDINELKASLKKSILQKIKENITN